MRFRSKLAHATVWVCPDDTPLWSGNGANSEARTPVRQPYDITQHASDKIWFTNDGRDGGAIPPPSPTRCN